MGSLVEQHFEHVGWLEVECFASKEDLATRSAVGNPLATPPVAELRQPSSFHPVPSTMTASGTPGFAV